LQPRHKINILKKDKNSKSNERHKSITCTKKLRAEEILGLFAQFNTESFVFLSDNQISKITT